MKDYLKDKKISQNRWTQIIEMLDENFDGPLKFFSMEDYKIHPKLILFKIINLCGKNIRIEDVQFIASKTNISKNEETLNYYFLFNRLYRIVPQFRLKNSIGKRLRNLMKPIFVNKIFSKITPKYDKDTVKLNEKEDYLKEIDNLRKRYYLLPEEVGNS